MSNSKYKLFLIILFLGITTFLSYSFFFRTENQPENKSIIDKIIQKEPEIKSDLQKGKVVNILLVGKDIGRERIAKGQRGYNTDTIILLSINPSQKRAIFTSFPRDIWQNNAKINAILVTQGMDSLLDAMSKISGQEITKHISIDFDGIRWLVDAFGGVPVDVKKSFTDNSFTNINDTAVMTVNFSEGTEIMNGDRALTFARSRKGNNGEGSDLMRAKRQHQILKGMTKAVENKNSQFFPFDIKEFYKEVVLHTETNISLEDAIYIFNFYKDIKDYDIQSLVLDDRYILHPGISATYGGAWVFIAKDSNYQKLHNDLDKFLNEGVNLDSTQN
jgi:LCP family protein required for cell wall assembly